MKVDLVRTFRFEAAHVTEVGPDLEECLHGHSYEVEVVVSGQCDEELGWLVDYAEISAAFEPLFDQLDHQLLNDVEGMEYPSLRGIEEWIYARLSPEVPLLKRVHVWISGDCAYRTLSLSAEEYMGLPERIRFGFEAAHALPLLPEDHKCRRMHGHSFVVEVAAENMKRLTPLLKGVYLQLDHVCLNEITELENPTSEMIARWIWKRLIGWAPDLSVVIVAETCTARCIYYGE